MSRIDPTYLHLIYNGLNSSAIPKDQLSSLPDGLLGIYEEFIPANFDVIERKKFLDFFGVWALMKKEVSIGFIASITGVCESEIFDRINKFSNWFVSPSAGKYLLYHERLRVFLLLRSTQNNLFLVNQRIIDVCLKAIDKKQSDESEYYALEHLSTHLFMSVMVNSADVSALKELAYDSKYWTRQAELSKGFEWSKKMLNEMMLWAVKFDDEEVIECALNQLDLKSISKNHGKRLVELINQGEIEAVLSHIKAMGGNHIEGFDVMFGFYLLCLMDLTFSQNSSREFRRDMINKIFSHLDEHIPEDSAVFDWEHLYSDFKVIIVKMASEWERMGLNFSTILKRSSHKSSIWGDLLLNDNQFIQQEPSKSFLISKGLIQGQDLIDVFNEFYRHKNQIHFGLSDNIGDLEDNLLQTEIPIDIDLKKTLLMGILEKKHHVNQYAQQHIIAWNIAPWLSEKNRKGDALKLISCINDKSMQEHAKERIELVETYSTTGDSDFNIKFKFLLDREYSNSLHDKRFLFDHGRMCFAENGWQPCLDFVNKFPDEHARNLFMAGCVDKALFSKRKTDIRIIKRVLPLVENDFSAYHDLILGYVIKLIFSEELPNHITDRLSRTLDIQWVLEIKKKLNGIND